MGRISGQMLCRCGPGRQVAGPLPRSAVGGSGIVPAGISSVGLLGGIRFRQRENRLAIGPAPPSGCREDNRFGGINLRKPAIAFAPAGGSRRKPANELQDVPVVLGQIQLNDRLVMGYTIP